MRIGDWSADVCSSDLPHQLAGMSLQLGLQPLEQGEGVRRGPGKAADQRSVAQPAHLAGIGLYHRLPQRALSVARHHPLSEHRKSVVKGKSGSVRVDPGGRRINNQKKKNTISEA